MNEEFKAVIKHLKNNKTPGQDQITAEILHVLEEEDTARNTFGYMQQSLAYMTMAARLDQIRIHSDPQKGLNKEL